MEFVNEYMHKPLPKTVRVEMRIVADVTLDPKLIEGMIDQYPKSYTNADDEELAKGILFASINPNLSQSNEYYDDWWDGIGNMRGLIKNLRLEG